MPLPQRWHKTKKRPPPPGFEDVEPVLEALENELRDKVKDRDAKKRKTEAMWPVHQINWQKSRYIYDMYYTHNRISRQVYQYCIDQKLIDAALIAKWKKPGYERLCSTYVINPSNFKFGTTSICRVPLWDRGTEQQTAQDPTTGCLGCASGKGAGPRNIFGNKYGQNLAAVQIAREQRLEKQRLDQEKAAAEARAKAAEGEDETDDDETDDGSDDDDEDDDNEDDFGPSPAAGIWAGSHKLQEKSEKIANHDEDGSDDEGPPLPPPPAAGNNKTGDNDDNDDDDDSDDEGPPLPPPKKARHDED
jgi:bud site selection protein 31